MVQTQKNNDRIEHDTQSAKSRKHAQELAADPEPDKTANVAPAKVEVDSTSNNGSVAKDSNWYAKHVQRGQEQLRNQGARKRADDPWDEEHVPGATEQHFLDQAARQRWNDREHARLKDEADLRVALPRHDGNSDESRRRDIPPHEFYEKLYERRIQSEIQKQEAAEQEDMRRDRTNAYRDNWVSSQTTHPPWQHDKITYHPTPPPGQSQRPNPRAIAGVPAKRQASPAWR